MCNLITQKFLPWVTVGSRALMGSAILLLVPNHARAQVPSNCNGDATFATLGRAVGQSQFITNGSTVSVVGSIANQTTFGGTTGCNASNIVAFFVCPNASGTLPGGGTNNLTSGTSLLFGPVTSPFSLQANPPDSIQFPTFSCTINVSAGVHTAQIGVFAEGILEDNVQSPNDPQSASKTISFNVFRPNICVTKECVNTCTPFGQPIQFSGTVTNCGDEPLINVNVSDNPSTTLSFTSNGVPVSGTGPFALAVGGSLSFTGQYTPSGSGGALCGPFADTITATGAGALTGAGVTNTASATCQVCNNPCVAVTKNCGPASISLGQSYTVSGLVTNCGNVPLTNVVVTDTITDATGGVTTVTINISGTLGIGGTAAVPTQTITPTLCGPSTDQFTVTADDLCPGATVAPASSATCVTQVICPPCIGVSKLIACGPCGANPAGLSYAPTATGVAGTNNPAFCYQIVVTNCGVVTLTNVQVSDPTIGLTVTLPTNLPPGTATAPIFHGASFGVGTTTNTVTATGQSQATGQTVTTNASAVAVVVPASVTCSLSLSSSLNVNTNGTGGCPVTLPSGTTNAPVTVTITINNTGQADLDVNIIGGNVLTSSLFDCDFLTNITFGTVFVPAGGTTNFVLGCVDVSCPGTNITAVVQGTAVASKTIPCVLDTSGNAITTAPSQCSACVNCATGIQCRVTGGGTLQPGNCDTNCVVLCTTLTDDEQCPGTVLDHISHGGQLGAPFDQQDCGQILGNPCIRGEWQHNRHYQGTGNPQDTIDTAFHSFNANTNGVHGVFDTLQCACLGCCSGGQFLGSAIANAVCNPDDKKICGPLPAPAPANAIIFTGLGVFSPANCGASGKNAPDRWFVFRVYIEDRSEPGGNHPGGAIEPATVYCFQAWDTGMVVVKHSDASTVATAFRRCLAQESCAFISSISTSSNTGVPPGTLPPSTVCNMPADINDCGPLFSGSQQIHPSTGATCTTTTPLQVIP